MIIKALIILAMIAIATSLFSALFFLMRDNGGAKRDVKALTLRISISLLLFIFLFIAYRMGWIHPHNLFRS